jgi:imidazolonepropionase-like amidohydrolase
MAPRDAIMAATSNAARAIGLADEVGSIEAGKWADLVAVRADPLEKIAPCSVSTSSSSAAPSPWIVDWSRDDAVER